MTDAEQHTFYNEWLRELRSRHQLSRRDIARLTCYSMSSVDAWLAPQGAVRYRPMPDRAFRLLTLQLEGTLLDDQAG